MVILSPLPALPFPLCSSPDTSSGLVPISLLATCYFVCLHIFKPVSKALAGRLFTKPALLPVEPLLLAIPAVYFWRFFTAQTLGKGVRSAFWLLFFAGCTFGAKGRERELSSVLVKVSGAPWLVKEGFHGEALPPTISWSYRSPMVS